MAWPTALLLLALNVFHEARGEPAIGQLAVAEVTLRRAADPRWPNDVRQVILEPMQFSWTRQGGTMSPLAAAKQEPRAWSMAWAVATLAMNHAPSVVPGATHYHKVGVTPKWVSKAIFIKEIGRHRFYKMQDERYR